MITPKTDIVQSVGRILRAKHALSHPIIYDFVDTHDVFQRQWLKRKTYYKSQNFKIIGTNSADYSLDISRWKTIYEPKKEGLNNACVININKSKKTISIKSNSSTDKSITQDSDTEEDDQEEPGKTKDKYLCGKCLLLPIKK